MREDCRRAVLVRSMLGRRGRGGTIQPHDNISLAKLYIYCFYIASHWKISQIIKLFLDSAEPFSIWTSPFLQVLLYTIL